MLDSSIIQNGKIISELQTVNIDFSGTFIITFGGISAWFYYGTSVEALLSLRNLESNSYNGKYYLKIWAI